MGAFGLALGALVRNTAAAITTLTLLLFVVPAIVDLLARWADAIGPYLPHRRADDHGRVGAPGELGPWDRASACCAPYVAVTIASGRRPADADATREPPAPPSRCWPTCC